MAGDITMSLECVLHRNTGTHASPVWNSVDDIDDVNVTLTKGEADVSRRSAGGWEAMKGAMLKLEISFGFFLRNGDASSEADFAALLASFISRTPIEFAILDGPIATAGSQGPLATCEVFTLTREEKLKEGVKFSVTIKPTDSDNPPVWHTT